MTYYVHNIKDLTPYQQSKFQTVRYTEAGVPEGFEALPNGHTALLNDASMRLPFATLIPQLLLREPERIEPFKNFTIEEFDWYLKELKNFVEQQGVDIAQSMSHQAMLPIFNKMNEYRRDQKKSILTVPFSDDSIKLILDFFKILINNKKNISAEELFQTKQEMHQVMSKILYRNKRDLKQFQLLVKLTNGTILYIPTDSISSSGEMAPCQRKIAQSTLIQQIAHMNATLTRKKGAPINAPYRVVAIAPVYTTRDNYFCGLGGFSYVNGDMEILPHREVRTAAAAQARRAQRLANKAHRQAIQADRKNNKDVETVGCGGCTIS